MNSRPHAQPVSMRTGFTYYNHASEVAVIDDLFKKFIAQQWPEKTVTKFHSWNTGDRCIKSSEYQSRSSADMFRTGHWVIALVLHLHILSTSSVRWQMPRLVSDYAPARLHLWSSAAPDCLPSATELFRSPLLVSGTCDFRTFCGCLAVPSQDTSVWHIISRPRVIIQGILIGILNTRCFTKWQFFFLS